jgi:hypothetical protein
VSGARPAIIPTLVAITDVLTSAAPLEPPADHTLAFAAFVSGHPGRIDIRRVDHRPAGVDERVENGEARPFVGGPVEDIASQR